MAAHQGQGKDYVVSQAGGGRMKAKCIFKKSL